MSVIVQLPIELEQRLRSETPNLEAAAKEAMLIELYRQEKLSHHELAQAMGLDRFETDGLLKKHNVTEGLPTNEELGADFERLKQLLDAEQ